MATERYTEAVGRRKTSIARVRLTPAAKASYEINGKELEAFFPVAEHRETVKSPFKTEGTGTYKITALLSGGGVAGQADALRHAIARALIDIDPNLRGALKIQGFLKRDPRAKERRKFGLKKARKAPQWSKR